MAQTFPSDFEFTGIASAAAVAPTPDNPYLYTADLRADWCIGVVPHGGYLSTVLLNASTHFFTSGPASITALSQPDAILSAFTFTTRCHTGPATLSITVLKPGRQYSVVRVDLKQADKTRLSAVITHGSLSREASTGLHIPIPPPAIPPFSSCDVAGATNDDVSAFRIAATKLIYAFPAGSRLGSWPETPQERVQWVKLADGTGMGVNDLAFLADMFMPIPENWKEMATLHWYPTLEMAVDVKCAPPVGGWEWVGMRVRTGVIRGGRMDIDVLMVNEGGEVVAVSRHAALVVGVERNTSSKKETGSKI